MGKPEDDARAVREHLDNLEKLLSVPGCDREAAHRLAQMRAVAEQSISWVEQGIGFLEASEALAEGWRSETSRKEDNHHWQALVLALDDARETWRRWSLLVAECRKRQRLSSPRIQMNEEERDWVTKTAHQMQLAGALDWVVNGGPRPEGLLLDQWGVRHSAGRKRRQRADVPMPSWGSPWRERQLVCNFFRWHGGSGELAERLESLDPAVIAEALDAWFSARRESWQPVVKLGEDLGLSGATVTAIENHARNVRAAWEKANRTTARRG